jgi:D-alanyl-D-alanine carboxypeptidase/D-alanyl-D-alanine-endopeptidase (penicillin-binding protein 4)
MSNVRRIPLAIAALAVALAMPAAAGARVDISRAVADPGLNPDQTSIAVIDVQNGETIASHLPDLPLNPASCMKLITSAAALSILGPGYRFTTDFLTDSGPAGGTVGTLYVMGTGDPSFINEEVWAVAAELRGKGLRRVTGGIAIDNSYFDSYEFPRKDGNDGRAYTALTSAVAVNFNSIGVEAGPGRKAGAPGRIELKPPVEIFRVINKTSTRGKFSLGIAVGTGPAGDGITVTGRIPAGFAPQTFWRAVPDPAGYAAAVIELALEENGIEVTGPARQATTTPGAHLILRHESRPLFEIVRDMNKNSQNFIAEQLLKHLGGARRGEPGSTASGVAVLEGYLRSIGMQPGSFEIENGSGLSSRTRVSAALLAKLLTAAYRDRAIRDYYMDSLSILGVDGTMKKWGREAPDLAGAVLAKTGTINDVSSLAGYLPMGNGRLAAFAIIANDLPRGAWGAKKAQMELLRQIAGVPR